MISGIGIDLIEVKRIRDAIERYGDRFVRRLFTPVEIEYCSTKKNPAMHYAGRFAAKEAAFKSLRRGWGGDISWKEVEIYNEPSGAPRMNLYGKALEVATEQQVKNTFVSISHIEEHATAIVVFET